MQFKVFIGIGACFFAVSVHNAHVDTLAVERQIVFPSGEPAPGAKVLLRTLNRKDGTLKQEKRVVADEKGVVHAEIEVDGKVGGDPFRTTSYAIVDAPGYALAFEDLNNWHIKKGPYDASYPLTLTSGYEVKGKILSPTGKPLPGAEVLLSAFANDWGNWRINYPAVQISTPEAITRSQADGSFALRAVDIIDSSGQATVRPMLIVRATQNGVALVGSAEPIARGVRAPDAIDDVPAQPSENAIRVFPATMIRGRIVSQTKAQPIADAIVTLRAASGFDLDALIGPVKSRADGRFEFQGVPHTFKLFAEASQPNYGKGWTSLSAEQGHSEASAPSLIEADIHLRPLVATHGKVVEADGKTPPLTPISINAIYDEGYNDGDIAVGRGVAVARINPDGTFAMKMPQGHNHLMLFGSGYREARDVATDLDIAPGDPKNMHLVIPVNRETGFLVHFSTNAAQGKPDYNFDAEYDLHIRSADGKEVTTNWGEWWYWARYKPTDTLEIRVTRFIDGFSQEVVPWTQLTPNSPTPANAAHWPRQIHLPLRQTVALRGKVVDAKTGKPRPGIKVQLMSRPPEAVKNIAPVTSGADGSFAFEGVPLPTQLSVIAHIDSGNSLTGTAATFPTPTGPGAKADTMTAVATQGDEGKQVINDIVLKLPPLPK